MEFKQNYIITDDGVIKAKNGRVLLISYDGKSPIVKLSHNGKTKAFTVHKLVAEAFVPNPDNCKFVLHKDGDCKNNNANNLVWSKRRSLKARVYIQKREKSTGITYIVRWVDNEDKEKSKQFSSEEEANAHAQSIRDQLLII